MSTTVLDHGNFKKVDKLDDDHLEFPGSRDLFSMPTNLITGTSSVSGTRCLLGAKASLQSIPLVHRERALVESNDHHDEESTNSKFAKHYMSVSATKPGEVEHIDTELIKVKNTDGSTSNYQLYHNFLMGRKSYITHTPTVKVGDKVKAGTLLATSNYNDKDGHMALGVNLTTAVMPFRSNNFEDAYAITESGAKKLAAEQMINFHLEKKFGIDANKDKYISLFPHKYTNSQINNIDSDGVVKVGTHVSNGDPIILAFSPKALKSTDMALGKLSKVLKNAYKDNSEYWDYEHDGTVTDVAKHGDLITVHIVSRRELLDGDKVSCVFGAKGVACYTDETEVFTREGWKKWTEVDTDTEFACLIDNKGVFRKAEKLYSGMYEGELYGATTRTIDYLVTPKHTLYIKKNTASPYCKVPVEARFGRHNIHKASAPFEMAEDSNGTIDIKDYVNLTVSKWHKNRCKTVFDKEAFAAFMGLYLSEGSLSFYENHNVGKTGAHVRSYKIQISQLKKENFPYIEDVLNRLGVKWWYLKVSGQYTFSSQYLYTFLKQFGLCDKKFIPKFMFNLGRPALAALLKALVMGDGTLRTLKNPLATDHWGYTSTSPQLCKDVEYLATLLGRSVRIFAYSTSLPNRLPIQFVSCANSEGFKETPRHQYKVNFKGPVYCAQVPGNLLYVRKNKRPMWCGNTIMPDSLAPTTPDGKPVDILLNSMSITSRVAPALPIALAMGKLAQKEGKTLNMPQFSKGSAIQDAIDTLAKHNISDVEQLYDPVTGKHIEAVVGPLYYTRLAHTAEDKVSTRSQGIGYSSDMQPTKVSGESSKRIGALGTTALLGHNAKHVLEDLGTVKGTRNDEFWRALKLGQTPPTPKVPFIFNKFVSSLQGAGVNVTREGNEFNILPLTDKDTLALSAGPINKATMFKPHQDELIHETGGLFDPNNVGVLGDRFNHIELNMTVPNPISEDYLRKLLGVTKKGFDELVVNGDIVKKLNDINVDSKIAEMRKYIEGGKKTKRDDAAKLLQFLTTLKNKKLELKDLLLTKVPIIPAMYRPVSKMGDTVLTTDVNHLYKDLILNNNSLKNVENVPDEVVHKLRMNQYSAVKSVFGLGDPINKKHADKNVKGLLSTMLGFKGGTAKSTMFQSKVVNKSLDLVGRAVVTPDAKLDIDQASVPQDLLWQVYKPFLVRRLVMKGVPATQAAEYVKKKNSMAVGAMNEELEHRPGIISRDPAWHKFNLMGFRLKPNANPQNKTISLNPLVFKGYSMDVDGDQINLNIPATEAARKEIFRMMPSKNLLSPKTFQPIMLPSNESALGLYGLSTENKNNTPKKFKTEAEALAAYHKGDLHAGDNLEIG